MQISALQHLLHYLYSVMARKLPKQQQQLNDEKNNSQTMKNTKRKYLFLISPNNQFFLNIFYLVSFEKNSTQKRRNCSSRAEFSPLQMAEILFFCAELYYACKIYGKLYKISTYISTAWHGRIFFAFSLSLYLFSVVMFFSVAAIFFVCTT